MCARVPTAGPSLALRQDAPTAAGCGRLFSLFPDVARGAAAERDGLTAALASVRTGAPRVVWRLDRLGRALKQRIARVTALDA